MKNSPFLTFDCDGTSNMSSKSRMKCIRIICVRFKWMANFVGQSCAIIFDVSTFFGNIHHKFMTTYRVVGAFFIFQWNGMKKGQQMAFLYILFGKKSFSGIWNQWSFNIDKFVFIWIFCSRMVTNLIWYVFRIIEEIIWRLFKKVKSWLKRKKQSESWECFMWCNIGCGVISRRFFSPNLFLTWFDS